MAKSTQHKKEEAEFRKLAKANRAAQKVEKAKAKKQQRAELRRRAKTIDGTPGEGEREATTKPRRTRALILPEEIQELRQRLGGDDAAVVENQKAKKGKARSTTRSSSGGGSSSGGAGVPITEPNYHFEIQYKKKLVMVDVVLHHVPFQKINVSETNSSTLVVDTCEHTKKYRLELPMPKGLRMKVEEGSFELVRGVLQCRLPILNEEIPATLQKEWDALQEKIRQQRALRFKVSQDGELKVRTRQALLPPDPKAQKLQQEAIEQRKRERQRLVAEDNEDEDNDEDAPARHRGKTEGDVASKASRLATSHLPPGKDAVVSTRTTAGARQDSGTTTQKPPKAEKKLKADSFRAEQAQAKAIALEATKSVRTTIAEKLRATQAVHQERLAKLKVKEDRKALKDFRRQEEFERILNEQKQRVVAEMGMQAAAEKERQQRVAARQERGKEGKSVSFA